MVVDYYYFICQYTTTITVSDKTVMTSPYEPSTTEEDKTRKTTGDWFTPTGDWFTTTTPHDFTTTTGDQSSTETSSESTTFSPTGCDSYEFQCSDGTCIPDYWECDDFEDCEDNSDEEHCTDTSTPRTTTQWSTTDWTPTTSSACERSEFRCNDGQCMHGDWECDNYRDCKDNSDEDHCETTTPSWHTTTPSWQTTEKTTEQQTIPCEKKLAFLQLLRSSEAAEKLRKSFVKAGGIGTCGKAGFYTGLQKSRLLWSFYATLRKSCRKASFSTAFTKLLHRAS